MRKLLVFIMILISLSISAQETVTLNVSDLTQSQLEQIKATKASTPETTAVETASKYIGLGKEIGVAINEGLNSTIDAANKFGNTKVGNFTLQILAWKLVGKDITRIALSLILIFVSIFVLIYNLKKYSTTKIRIKGAWYQFWVSAEYKTIEIDDDCDNLFWKKVAFILLFLVSIWIAYGILP